MTSSNLVRRAVLAGALALSFAGVSAGIDAVQAMPTSTALVGPSAALTTVQYMRYPNYRYRRFNRHRRAGLYRCGPGALKTRLERRACGG